MHSIRNKDEERSELIRANMETYLGMRDTTKIISQIQTEPQALSFLFGSIGANLHEDEDIHTDELVFYLELIERLIQEFGAPIIGALEEEEFILFLKSCLDKGLQEEVRSLTEICIQAVSFDAERETIPLITTFFVETYGRINYPYFKDDGPFAQAFLSCMRIFKLERDARATKGAEGVIKNLISEALKYQKFNSPQYSKHENYFMQQCRTKLQQILEDINNTEQQAKQTKEEQKQYYEQVKSMPKEEQLKNRTGFMKDETIFFRESIEDEYKDYNFPLTESLEKTLAKTICSFLNTVGGRIYIGITDDRKVKGLKVTNTVKLQIESTMKKILSWFDPEIASQNLVRQQYLPIFSKDGAKISDLFVVKIIIKQGNPSELYSACKDALECYIRWEGQSKFLNAKETKTEIKNRLVAPGAKIADQEFNDPEPASASDEVPITIRVIESKQPQVRTISSIVEAKMATPQMVTSSLIQNSNQSKGSMIQNQSNSNRNKQSTKSQHFDQIVHETERIAPIKLYQIYMDGLPAWTEEEFQNFLDELKFGSYVSHRMFKQNNGTKCKGNAYVNFSDYNDALQFVDAFNGSLLFGNKLTVKFKEEEPQKKK